MGTRAIQLRDPDTSSRDSWNFTDDPTAAQFPERNSKPNLGQALHVLAGATYVDRLSTGNSRLGRLLQSGAPDEKIFEEFYLAALGRFPAADELQELKTILRKAVTVKQDYGNLCGP